jgi:hypothetical protein
LIQKLQEEGTSHSKYLSFRLEIYILFEEMVLLRSIIGIWNNCSGAGASPQLLGLLDLPGLWLGKLPRFYTYSCQNWAKIYLDSAHKYGSSLKNFPGLGIVHFGSFSGVLRCGTAFIWSLNMWHWCNAIAA